eukprot:363974-Chlamydomonas_euryale.AAC.17
MSLSACSGMLVERGRQGAGRGGERGQHECTHGATSEREIGLFSKRPPVHAAPSAGDCVHVPADRRKGQGGEA